MLPDIGFKHSVVHVEHRAFVVQFLFVEIVTVGAVNVAGRPYWLDKDLEFT
jgi:hypothetical protein